MDASRAEAAISKAPFQALPWTVPVDWLLWFRIIGPAGSTSGHVAVRIGSLGNPAAEQPFPNGAARQEAVADFADALGHDLFGSESLAR